MADDLLFSLTQIKPKNCILSSSLYRWFPSSSSFSPSFFNCSFPRESTSVYEAYLRSHFSLSQPKTLRGRARGCLSELGRATCPEESRSFFCFPFSPAEFLAAASNLSSSTATGPDKAAYPMLKHLPRSGIDFLLHIFNLSRTLHSFPSIWKTSSIIPIHKIESLWTLLLPSGLSLLPPAYQSFMNASFYSVYFSFWNLTPFSLHARPVSAMDGSHYSAMEAMQGALFRLERWSKYWCLPLNPNKCEASFFSVDPHQANLQPNLLLLGSRLRFNLTPTFLRVTFDRTLSFSKHASSLKAKFFPRLKALRCISASSWGPSKAPLGQTWSKTKTLQIVLESFCVHSPAHASFCFS